MAKRGTIWQNPNKDAIKSCEIFPSDRNDRGTLGGGEIVLAHNNKIYIEQPELVKL